MLLTWLGKIGKINLFKVNNIKFKSSEKSILEEIINQGYSIPFNCKDGRCKNCVLLDIVTGKNVLACQVKAEKNKCFICENISDITLPKIKTSLLNFQRLKKKVVF